LEEYVIHLMMKMNQAGRRKWILANSDSCPPGVSVEKFKAVTRLAREFIWN
jgi:hypothetical protein